MLLPRGLTVRPAPAAPPLPDHVLDLIHQLRAELMLIALKRSETGPLSMQTRQELIDETLALAVRVAQQ